MNVTLKALALFTLATSMGCRGPRLELQPLHAPRATPRRRATVEHDLHVEDRNLGMLTVWAKPAKEGAHERLWICLGVKIRNEDREQAIRVVPYRTTLEVFARGGTSRLSRNPEVHGEAEVPPGGTRRLELRFLVSSALEPRQIVGAELSWTLESGAKKFTRTTPFVRCRRWHGHTQSVHDPWLRYGWPRHAHFDDCTHPWHGHRVQ